MKNFVYFTSVVFLAFSACVQAEPTFADLAVLLAKGQFKEHIPADASVEECAAFLNQHGVCFSIFDLADPERQVTREEFARVIGQSRLLFTGEANVVGGCIKRPDDATSWVDYCLLNDVGLQVFWVGFLRRTEQGSLPEVNRFYKKV